MRRFVVVAFLLYAGAMTWCQSNDYPLGIAQNPAAPTTLQHQQPFNFGNGQLGRRNAAAPVNAVYCCAGVNINQSKADAQFDLNHLFRGPGLAVSAHPTIVARNENPLTLLPPGLRPHAKAEPIPTNWPNARFEPIPTVWPNLKVEQISRPGDATP